MSDMTMTFEQIAYFVGVDDATLKMAEACTKPRIAVSGKLASGKDTVALEMMRILGFPDAVRVSVAEPLRKEVDAILTMIRGHEVSEALMSVAAYGEIPESVALKVHALASAALAQDKEVTSHTRTGPMRSLLQYWGTEVRIAKDPLYWTKKAMHAVFLLLAADKAVYITDARFAPDLDMARGLCFYALRLEVPAFVRESRLFARDGLMLDPAAENHPSEQSLENYPNFDIVVDNSGDLQQTVADVLWKMASVPTPVTPCTPRIDRPQVV